MSDNHNLKESNRNDEGFEHEESGDKIHHITAYLEHLMDIFEIGIAIIVAFGFVVSIYPLVRELPQLGSMSNGTTAYRHFLESALDLVIGIEFIKMLIKHTPGSVVEVLLFALSRHMVLEGGNAMENLLTVCAIAVIFAIRRFLHIETFRFRTGKDKGPDWLSDWKEIKEGGSSTNNVRKKAASKDKAASAKDKAASAKEKSASAKDMTAGAKEKSVLAQEKAVSVKEKQE